ncbi:MAG: flagellar basal body P-ring formation chaperone FlgA [Planctomycetota bacterium]
MKPALCCILAMVTPLLAMCAAAQETVHLLPVTRIPPGHTLTLGDVARLEPDSDLAGVVLIDEPKRSARSSHPIVTVDLVRRSLDAAGITASRATVRGDACTVITRVRRVPTGEPHSISQHKQPAAAMTSARTLEEHVRARVLASLGLPAERVELTFDARDADRLATPTAGWTVEAHITGFSRRTPVRVTMYGADGTVRELALRAGVRVQRTIARAAEPLQRGLVLTHEHLTPEPVWVAPDDAAVVFERAVGSALRRDMDAGSVLTRGHIAEPLAIERGDVVIVHIASGTVVLRREARALGDGRIGETIDLEPLTGEGRIRARVESPGRAVIVLQAGHIRERG